MTEWPWLLLMDEMVLTIDIDWAPHYVVEPMINDLVEAGVKATWFATHEGETLSRLALFPDLFEIGIHPNFLPGSTHGSTDSEILDRLLEMVPEAVSVRSHASVFSGRLLHLLASRPQLTIEATTFLPGMHHVKPFRHRIGGRHLWRIPYVWADDHALEDPTRRWALDAVFSMPGLKVVSFHPIHVFLNTDDYSHYQRFKELFPHLSDDDEADVSRLVRQGEGASTAFRRVVRHLAERSPQKRLCDLVLREA